MLRYDPLTPEQRSERMSRVRAADTKPEMLVRRMAHALGFRYRLHVKTLPGCPDLVFSSRRKVIFVHGCFWHQHGCGRYRMPRTRKRFWNKKLKTNVQRDAENYNQLAGAGWEVLVVWECEVADPVRLVGTLTSFLRCV
ncbi:MAG: Very short patch repair protein [Candidatus Latescibacteria bacterium ADurb.Bin168]|nr:MAG: Very short patch repair protein [Candidatus Latescibacteria bacterium ADurb.Bin168]